MKIFLGCRIMLKEEGRMHQVKLRVTRLGLSLFAEQLVTKN